MVSTVDTAPHIVDPRNPGAVDEILHLGDFWDEGGIKKWKNEIIESNRKIKNYFDRAYQYLKAAYEVYREWRKINQSHLRQEELFKALSELREEITDQRKPIGDFGSPRNLFAGAITPDGPVNYLETIFGEAEKLYILEGPPGSGKAFLVEKILDSVIEKGLKAEVFYCSLDPQKPEHIWIPEIETGVITSSWPHIYKADDHCRLINTGSFLRELDTSSAEAVKEARLVFHDLFERAIKWLNKALRTHDELESYYIPNMNFKGIEELRKKILRRLLDMGGELQGGRAAT